MRKHIYLDYASSTPLDRKVFDEMLPFLKQQYGNPSSVHWYGQRARAAVEKAREKVATFLNCAPLEIVFTSGATEANNLAVRGVVSSAIAQGVSREKIHVVSSAIEHESVLAPLEEMERQGMIELTKIAPSKDGIIDPEEIKNALREETVLISITYANSEIGTIQPIARIGSMIADFRNSKSHAGTRLFPFFHTDAAQAAHWLSCDTKKLVVDLLTVSAHKIGGPKGSGALFFRSGTPLVPLLLGGGQEYQMRSGTEHVAGIVGMGAAAERLLDPRLPVALIKVRRMRDKLVKGMIRKISGASVSGTIEKRLPNNAHIVFDGVDGHDLVVALDQEGVACSAGSACSEKTREPSRVLLAMGMTPDKAKGALRLTIGTQTTPEEIEKALKILPRIVSRLRAR